MKITLDGFTHYRPAQYGADATFAWFAWESGISGSICVGPQQITIDVPDDFNPVAAEVSALQAKLDEAGREFLATKTRILEQISKLQAIGCATEAA